MLEFYKSISKLTEFNFGDKVIHTDHCTSELKSSFKELNFYGIFMERMYEDFKIAHGTINFHKSTKLICTSVEASIQMIFLLQGNLSNNLSSESKNVCFKLNTHNLVNCPCGRSVIEFGRGKTQFVTIQFTPELFQSFMPPSAEFESFNALFQEQKSGYLLKNNLPITSAIQMILEDIIRCPLKGHFGKIFLYAKVLELLLLQLKQCRFDGEESSISDDDVLKIYQAQRYVLNNYDQHITISTLAKQIGTNEFTLKKGFKELVGNTVFGYINDIKMNKAKRMLMDQKLNVSQVSELIGYKNPQHFSTAFKKKFGVIPSKFKEH